MLKAATPAGTAALEASNTKFLTLEMYCCKLLAAASYYTRQY